MPRLRLVILLSLSVLLFVSIAFGQTRRGDTNPFLKRTQPSQWDTRREIQVFAGGYTNRSASGVRQSATGNFNFSRIKIVAPMIEGSATASMDPTRFETVLTFESRTIDTEPELLPELQCDEQVGVWEGANLSGRKMKLKIEGPVTTYGVTINERAANSVQWPTNGFPEEVAACLEPQFFIESDDPDVIRLMNRWTQNNPQGPPPYMVAKALAGMMQEQFQPSGVNVGTNYPTRFGGVQVDGAASVARRMRGSESDMASLLAAVYRAAGIPARVVVGWDVAGSPGGREHVPAPDESCRSIFDPDIQTHAVLRTWVEFYLYDETRKRGGWIPVDIFMMRQISNRMGKLERVWNGFGGGMCFDHLIPITFHFVPPSTVVAAETPALWGWETEPAPPAINQELIFDAFPAVRRGGQR